MAMYSVPFFSAKDLLRSVFLGVLLGWLLISIHDPSHPRFDFMLSFIHAAQTNV